MTNIEGKWQFTRKRHRIPNMLYVQVYTIYTCNALGEDDIRSLLYAIRFVCSMHVCRGYRSFLSSKLPSFRIDRRARKRPWFSRDGCDCRSLHTPRIISDYRAFITRAHTSPTPAWIFLTARATNYPCPFFVPKRTPRALALPCRTDKVDDDSLDDERNWNIADSARLRARIIINATTYRHSGENNWIVKRDSRCPLFIPITMRRKQFLVRRRMPITLIAPRNLTSRKMKNLNALQFIDQMPSLYKNSIKNCIRENFTI